MSSSMVMALYRHGLGCAETAIRRMRPQYIGKCGDANRLRDARFVPALVSVRLVAAPGRLEIRRRQGLLRTLAGRADRVGWLRTELLVEELVKHLGAGLRPM